MPMMIKDDILKAVDQLEDYGFNSRKDTIAEYSANGIIFFKKIDEQRYIVFHFYRNKNARGFDCWISTYERAYHIGKIPAIEMEIVKSTFDFEGDWKLIAPFLFGG